MLLGGLFVASLLGDGGVSSSAFPDRPADAEDQRIGAPPAGRTTGGDFAFMATQDGSDEPVTYDPCVPIHVVVRPRTMVEGGMRMLQEAIDQVQDATGLTFVVDGVTDEPAPKARDVTDADDHWRPVTVSWSDPRSVKKLKGGIAGYGGSTPVKHGGRLWFVTGRVVLDGPQLAEIMTGPGGWASARSVVMHELGHLVGLKHVTSPGELMQPRGSAALTEWGEGDRTGLAALGRGPCIDY